MNAFWKWLMKTNARLVFLCAFIALLITAGYWAWVLTRPVYEQPLLPTGIKKKSMAPLGLLGFVDRQLSPDLYKLPGNSFLTPGTPERMYIKVERPPVAVVARPPKEKPPPPEEKPPPPPKPKPPPVMLTYKGIYKASDGSPQAWINDSQSKGSSFYDIGSTLFGATLDSITPTEAIIILPNGSSLELKFGKPQPIID